MSIAIRFIAAVAGCLFLSSSGWANHTVLVEGNCDSPVPGTTLVSPGTCGDFDGDGRIGTAEDTDGADRIFGTINAALGPGTGAAAGTGANQNGTLLIVASGRFAERIVITAENGNVTLMAAPGIHADINAVLQGDPAGGNVTRQGQNGIVVNTENRNHRVTLENLTVQNWIGCISIQTASDVAVVNVHVSNCVNFGIRAGSGARVSIDQSHVISTGYRVGPGAGTFPQDGPNPGAGIIFTGSASGAVFRTEVTNSFGAGILDESTLAVQIKDVYLFRNNPDLQGIPPEN